jgi:hypothetical protein
VSGYQIIRASATVAADSGGQVTGTCPAGKRLLSAAAELINSSEGPGISIDITSSTRATAYAYNYDTTAADTLNIDIICAVVS